MSESKKGIHADRILVRPGPTPEEMKQTAIDMLRSITGKPPTEDDLTKMDAQVQRMKEEDEESR